VCGSVGSWVLRKVIDCPTRTVAVPGKKRRLETRLFPAPTQTVVPPSSSSFRDRAKCGALKSADRKRGQRRRCTHVDPSRYRTGTDLSDFSLTGRRRVGIPSDIPGT
jgi:hypothetical protein